MLLVLFFACAEAPPPGDAQLHLAALELELEPGLEACSRLSQAERVGECTVDLMVLHNRVGAGPCEALPASTWRHECFFLAADNTDLDLETRMRLCERTGPFVEDCLRHQSRGAAEGMAGSQARAWSPEARSRALLPLQQLLWIR